MVLASLLLSLDVQAAPDLDRSYSPGVIPPVGRAEVFRNAYGAQEVVRQDDAFRLLYANGDEVFAQRVADSAGLLNSSGTDAELKSRYSSGAKYLGGLPFGGGYRSLFSLSIGFQSDDAPDFVGSLGERFEFAVSIGAEGPVQSKRFGDSENMAVYLLQNVSGARFAPQTYALFFGNLNDRHIDADSVDASVQVGSLVPLPVAALGAMVGLGLVAIIRRRPLA